MDIVKWLRKNITARVPWQSWKTAGHEISYTDVQTVDAETPSRYLVRYNFFAGNNYEFDREIGFGRSPRQRKVRPALAIIVGTQSQH
jgi:hypothetical protein